MGSLNNLPNELLLQIVDKLGARYSGSKWMFVNRQWFDLYLSIEYKDISIKLDLSDNKLNKIIQSTFQPGRWVKSVKLTGMTVPTNVDHIDYTSDPLSLFMEHSPQVEQVDFISIADDKFGELEWKYFSTVLLKKDIWKLRYLPEPSWDDNEPPHFSCYFNCAYHSRDSLKKLDLMQGMIERRNFSGLIEFKKLLTLYIGENVVKDITDVYTLLPISSCA